MIQGADFVNVRDLLNQWRTRPNTPETAKEFVKLFFVNLYSIQARIQGFGNSSMLFRSETVPALTKDSLTLQFEARGAFGLGNSGLQFTIPGAEELPGYVVNANVFAGVYQMEGLFAISVRTNKGDLPVGTLDSSQIKFANGVSVGGNYIVRFDNQIPGSQSFLISYADMVN
jgi:hypothetical protein